MLGLMSTPHVQYMLLFLVLAAVNSDQFQVLCSYTLLLKPPILMSSWWGHVTLCCTWKKLQFTRKYTGYISPEGMSTNLYRKGHVVTDISLHLDHVKTSLPCCSGMFYSS